MFVFIFSYIKRVIYSLFFYVKSPIFIFYLLYKKEHYTMYIVYPNIGNTFLIYTDNLEEIKDEYRITISKPEAYNLSKTFSIVDFNYVEFNDLNYILQLFFCEVPLINQTLIGDVSLQDNPGEWIMTIEGKNILENNWTEVYTDLLRMIAISDNIITYSN